MSNQTPQQSHQSPEWEIALLTFVVLISIFLGIGYVLSLSLNIPIPWLVLLIAAGVLTGVLYNARRRRQTPTE